VPASSLEQLSRMEKSVLYRFWSGLAWRKFLLQSVLFCIHIVTDAVAQSTMTFFA